LTIGELLDSLGAKGLGSSGLYLNRSLALACDGGGLRRESWRRFFANIALPAGVLHCLLWLIA
jgi:hypothetical protein